jgi:NADP-dependent 3-hydroxy acid dehydrogenase YdfG
VFSIQSIDEMSPDVLDYNLAVNLRGTVLTVRAFLPGLKRRESGTIIQIGSIAGRKAFAGNGAYSASKFGVRGFHEVLLEELRGTGVRATLLEPAATNTSIWDSIEAERSPDIPDRESMLDPKSVAACVVFVAARSAGVQIPYLPVEAI